MAAQVSNSDLPCDGDGICMVCKVKPSSMADETLTCKTCATPWHVPCLSLPPQSMGDALQWNCPDCSSLYSLPSSAAAAAAGQLTSDLTAAIRAIEADTSLTERQKAERRQELMCKRDGDGDGNGNAKPVPSDGSGGSDANAGNDLLDLLGGNLNCSICMQLPERPITTPCGHNFCLKCFQKWVGQGKRTCANCRNSIPPRVASNPRINSALVMAIRMAKVSKSNAQVGQPKVYHFVHNQNRPDKCFTTERAKKSGKANACSGKIFVTAPPDHFGPILAENDPTRNQGVLVGESWEDRMECRQWGTHLPHVAGIAGQSGHGAQSVALSGGYEDDEDHGEWFLYTGSGGRDLSGNKRTNVTHSFDQKFEKLNEALRVSCRKGYPVRVVRSHKEKRSAYAPETGVRYDGVYRIENCWRKNGNQGYKVCRYLFVRCDNEPAPWTSNDHGDLPRPLPAIPELNAAIDLTERKEPPAWDYDEEKGRWLWMKPPPPSKKRVNTDDLVNVGEERRKFKRRAQNNTVRERLLKEFSCNICRKVMNLPITTPCAHNFCKGCLEGAFAGQTLVRQRNCEGRRTLRAQKNVMKCPHSSCTNDIAEFLQNPQINRELMGVIESLKQKDTELEENGESSSNDGDDVQEEHGISDDDDETENGAQEEANENDSVESDTNVTSKQEKANSRSPKLVVNASIERQIGTNDGKTENSVKPQSDDKALLEQHDGVKDENTENIVKPRENPKESKAKQTRKQKKSENGANDGKTQNSVKPQSDVKASLVQHDVANDENAENIVNPQENRESKVKQTHKQKKSENGGNLPLVNVGATTRSKRAKLAAA